MSDKDYSGCGFSETYFEDEEIRCNCPIEEDGICENNPNCYYKQLQAKTDECEELRKELEENNPIFFYGTAHIIDVIFKKICSKEFAKKAENGVRQSEIVKELIKIKQENTALKQDNKILVEALERVIKDYFCNKPFWGSDECLTCTMLCIKNIAKTALGKIKGCKE